MFILMKTLNWIKSIELFFQQNGLNGYMNFIIRNLEDMFLKLHHTSGLIQIPLLAIGVFFGFFTPRFRTFSSIASFTAFFWYLVFVSFGNSTQFFKGIGTYVSNFLPYAFGDSPNSVLYFGIFISAVIYCLILCLLLTSFPLISIVFFVYFIYNILEPIFLYYCDPNKARTLCSLLTLAVTLIIIIRYMDILRVFSAIIICFFGHCIIFTILSKQIKVFEDFGSIFSTTLSLFKELFESNVLVKITLILIFVIIVKSFSSLSDYK